MRMKTSRPLRSLSQQAESGPEKQSKGGLPYIRTGNRGGRNAPDSGGYEASPLVGSNRVPSGPFEGPIACHAGPEMVRDDSYAPPIVNRQHETGQVKTLDCFPPGGLRFVARTLSRRTSAPRPGPAVSRRAQPVLDRSRLMPLQATVVSSPGRPAMQRERTLPSHQLVVCVPCIVRELSDSGPVAGPGGSPLHP